MADNVLALLQYKTHLYLANVVSLRYHTTAFEFLITLIVFGDENSY